MKEQIAFGETSLKNSIIQYIYKEIMSNHYSPNEHIKESELSEILNVSRAPVREALMELVGLGILVKHERRGIFLKEITQKEVLDTYYTKGLIEGYLALDFILRATEDEYGRLDEIVREMEASAKISLKGCVDVGDTFHKYYLKYSTNTILIEALERVNVKSHILFFWNWSKLYTVKDIVDRHQKIADALRSKERVLIEETIRNHYTETGMKIALQGFKEK
jgi:DNA-binding GntR family transcriptional regulator